MSSGPSPGTGISISRSQKDNSIADLCDVQMKIDLCFVDEMSLQWSLIYHVVSELTEHPNVCQLQKKKKKSLHITISGHKN